MPQFKDFLRVLKLPTPKKRSSQSDENHNSLIESILILFKPSKPQPGSAEGAVIRSHFPIIILIQEDQGVKPTSFSADF